MAEGDGYGQLRPEDAASEYNSQRFLIKSLIAKLDTVKVVKVVAVDTAAKTVTVLPLVQQIDGNNQVTSQGQIYGVPYMALRYGVNAVLADPAEGDIGLLLCADRDISAVKSTKAEAPPGSLRQYDQADGVYLGGVLNAADPTQYVKFTDTGMELHDKNGNALVSDATGWTFTGAVKFNQAVTMQGNLQLAGAVKSDTGGTYGGDIVTSGKVQSGSIILGTHRHTGVTTGGGTSGGPTP